MIDWQLIASLVGAFLLGGVAFAGTIGKWGRESLNEEWASMARIGAKALISPENASKVNGTLVMPDGVTTLFEWLGGDPALVEEVRGLWTSDAVLSGPKAEIYLGTPRLTVMCTACREFMSVPYGPEGATPESAVRALHGQMLDCPHCEGSFVYDKLIDPFEGGHSIRFRLGADLSSASQGRVDVMEPIPREVPEQGTMSVQADDGTWIDVVFVMHSPTAFLLKEPEGVMAQVGYEWGAHPASLGNAVRVRFWPSDEEIVFGPEPELESTVNVDLVGE